MFSKLIFFVFCIATYSLSSPATLPIITNDNHDSHLLQKPAGNPSNIAIEDLEVIASVKETILHYTFETDKIIFVGNTPSYIYYSFKPSDNRQVQLIPYSGGWMHEFFDYSRKTAKSIVKKYCEDFIDPLGIHGEERLVLVDFSMTGDGVFQFKELLEVCVKKNYSPSPPGSRPEFLNVVFLDVLGISHYASKVRHHWGRYTKKGHNLLEVFGFTGIRHIIPTSSNAANVIEKFRTAGEGNDSLIRLLPTFNFPNWRFPEKVEIFQTGELLSANIQMIRDYFKDKKD